VCSKAEGLRIGGWPVAATGASGSGIGRNDLGGGETRIDALSGRAPRGCFLSIATAARRLSSVRCAGVERLPRISTDPARPPTCRNVPFQVVRRTRMRSSSGKSSERSDHSRRTRPRHAPPATSRCREPQAPLRRPWQGGQKAHRLAVAMSAKVP